MYCSPFFVLLPILNIFNWWNLRELVVCKRESPQPEIFFVYLDLDLYFFSIMILIYIFCGTFNTSRYILCGRCIKSTDPTNSQMVVLHWGIEGLTWGRRQCEKLTQAHTRSCECPGRCEFVSIIIIISSSSIIIIIILKHIQRKVIVIFTSTFCVELS